MISNPTAESRNNSSKVDSFKSEVVQDFWIALISREASLLARREVLTGKAKFGILGDGKEVPQLAMARAFKKGDWRSGYYRDQTFMLALGLCTLEDFFAQLYADSENDPFSGGRQMNAHFATATIDENGEWTDHLNGYNVSSDISCTGGQMARALGIALASKVYRNNKELEGENTFSKSGNEVSFCTIGDSSTSEGVFWETMNAASVSKVPLLTAVWDDGYGISVPVQFQTVKGSISKAMEGFLINEQGEGLHIYTVKAWDYPRLCAVFEKVTEMVRKDHTPALIHVEEVTQPQGHSTSGSHERYKSKERLQWEKDHDCIEHMADWMVDSGLISREKVDEMRLEAKKFAREAKNKAWRAYHDPVLLKIADVKSILSGLTAEINEKFSKRLDDLLDPSYSDVVRVVRRVKYQMLSENRTIPSEIHDFLTESEDIADSRYHTHLYSETPKSSLQVPVVHPVFSEASITLNGYQVLNKYFDFILEKRKEIIAFGEDVGQIGDVNQGFAGMQEKYGANRIFDSGIREWSIMGGAIGSAMRGLRPIAEIQYLDYLIYGLPALTDDLATLRYRSNGIQCAPAIIRTRGHRLEGIWHAGSPLGLMINSLRGMIICVPRNMVQAVGFYNTMLQSDDPAIIVECLNGYRLKETVPDNLGAYNVPLGVPEVLEEGTDLTLVTYGSCVREAQKGIEMLKQVGISVELIDVQTLLPFDLEGIIVNSLKKTNRIIFMDEDVPGGATAFMMKKVLEDQNGYQYLDSPPVTLTSKAHRPPFGSDGDYFSKPNPDNVFELTYRILKESDPDRFA